MSESRNDAGWGGARPNAGRKPGVEKRTVQIRLTAEQHEKLKKLGGSKWIAEQIEGAVMRPEVKEALREEL